MLLFSATVLVIVLVSQKLPDYVPKDGGGSAPSVVEKHFYVPAPCPDAVQKECHCPQCPVCQDRDCPEKYCPEKTCPEKDCPDKICPTCPEKSCPERSCPEKTCPEKVCDCGDCPSKTCPECPALAPRKPKGISFKRVQPYLNHIMDKLMQKTGKHYASKETEEDMGGDRWWWIDDNAKVLEVFTVPGVYERYKKQAHEIAEFMMYMSKEGLMFRRQSMNLVELKSKDHEAFGAHNGIMDHYGNLNRNQLSTGYRFHDGRDEEVLHSFAGFVLEFTIDGTEYSTRDYGLDQYKRVVEKRSDVVVARFTVVCEDLVEAYVEYHVREDTTVIRQHGRAKNLQEKPAQNVRITFKKAFPRIAFTRVAVKHATAGVVHHLGHEVQSLPVKDLDWFSVYSTGPMGYSYAFHILIRDRQLTKVTFVTEGDRVNNIEMQYGGKTLQQGETLTAQDHSLLTSGGLHRTMPYDELFSTIESRKELTDFSISYDYGAELSSVASFTYFLKGGHYDLPSEEKVELVAKGEVLNQWLLRHLDVYMENFVLTLDGQVDKTCEQIFLRGHAYALIANVKMLVINKEDKKLNKKMHGYIENSIEIMDILRVTTTKENKKGAFNCYADGRVFLDCHSAALLALSYLIVAYEHLEISKEKETLMTWLEDGILSLSSPVTMNVVSEQASLLEVVTIVKDPANGDGVLWNFKSSIFLRVVNLMQEVMNHQDDVSFSSATENKLEIVKANAMLALVASIRDRTKETDAIPYKEFVTSFRSGETNSETQPWCMLGFFREYEQVYYRYFHKGGL